MNVEPCSLWSYDQLPLSRTPGNSSCFQYSSSAGLHLLPRSNGLIIREARVDRRKLFDSGSSSWKCLGPFGKIIYRKGRGRKGARVGWEGAVEYSYTHYTF